MNFDTQTIIVIVIVLMIGIALGYLIGCKLCCAKCPVPKDSEIISDGNLKSVKVSGTLQTGDSVNDTEAMVEGGDITCFSNTGLEIVSVTVRDPYNKLASMTLEPVYFEGGATPMSGLTKEQKELIKQALKFIVNTMFKLIYDQSSLQSMANSMLKKTIKLKNIPDPISRAQQFDMIVGFTGASFEKGLMCKVMNVFLDETDITEIVIKLGEAIRGSLFTGLSGMKAMVSWLKGLNDMFQDLYKNKDKFSATVVFTIMLSGLIGVIIKSFQKKVKAFAMWFKQTTNDEIYAFSTLMQFMETSINSTLGVTGRVVSKISKNSNAKERLDALKVGIGNWNWEVLFRELIPELLISCKSATQAENIISAIMTRNPEVILPTQNLKAICERLRKPVPGSGEDDDGMDFICDESAGEDANKTELSLPAPPKAETTADINAKGC